MAIATAPTRSPITRETLEDRWQLATTAPWIPGQWSKLGKRLRRDLEDLVQRVAMVDFDHLQNAATPEGNAYPVLVDELEQAIRSTLIRSLDERGMARHGWESITSIAPEPVR